MQIPLAQGEFCQKDFFIYSAADENYFDEFVPALASSIKNNTSYNLHLHLYNPRPDQLEFCRNNEITWTAEYVPLDLFTEAAKRFEKDYLEEPLHSQKLRILTAMSKGNDVSIQDRLRKTYFACARFIRLKEFVKSHQKFFAIDVDAIIRHDFPLLEDKDFYMHHISGKKARYLAGGIFYTGKNFTFFHRYSKMLEQYIQTNQLYWGLDQDLLDELMPNCNWGQLPIQYIDWNMDTKSYIWTAKGKRKDLELFKNEQNKYRG